MSTRQSLCSEGELRTDRTQDSEASHPSIAGLETESMEESGGTVGPETLL